MLVAWSGLELLRYGLYRAFGFSFEISDVFDTTIADLTYMHAKEPDLWPITYAGYSWGLSWYYMAALLVVAVCYIYLLILVIFRHSTHESPPRTSWWSLYADLWPIEMNCVFVIGLTRCLSLMIINGASFQVYGGTAQGAARGKSATWAHLTSHYYLAVFVITTNVWMNVSRDTSSLLTHFEVAEASLSVSVSHTCLPINPPPPVLVGDTIRVFEV